MNRMAVMAGVTGALIGAAAVALAGNGSAPDRAAMEAVVHDYILAHPEILSEAAERLQQKEAVRAVDANRAAYETPYAGAWAGAARGDVVLVEFFDYACGFCRRSNPDIDRLLKEDKQLKVVWRELPVLGPDSRKASTISLAAARQGKFKPFHDRMFALGRPTAGALAEAARAAGVTPLPDSPDIQAEIDRNYELARAVNASGTPTFVVGDKVLQGAVGYDALKQAVAEARTSKRP